jgi:parvulin-like peptidyl-prolyl isomerase
LKTDIKEDESKKYYEDNPAKFEEPERVRAAHILLGTKDPATGADLPEDKKAAKRKQMDDLLKRAKGGEDFGKLAKEYSEDPGSKEKGGEYTFPRGQMVPEFESAAFSLNTNQVSDIVNTSFGYHIIKLYEKLPARKEAFNGLETKTIYPKPDGQKITIKEVLNDQSMQKAFPDYMRKIRKEAGVEILDDKLKMDELPPTSNSNPNPGVPPANPSPEKPAAANPNPGARKP